MNLRTSTQTENQIKIINYRNGVFYVKPKCSSFVSSSKCTTPDLPHTEGVLLPSVQKAVGLHVSDQGIQDPSTH